MSPGEDPLTCEPVLPSTWISFLLPGYVFDQYYSEFIPGLTENDAATTITDLERSDVLILEDLSAQGRLLFPHLPDGSDAANRYVAEHFCVVDRVGAYEVLQKRGGTNALGAEFPRPPPCS